MSWWKIGFHLTSTGNMNGIGDYIQALRDNDKPVSLQSVDSAGVIFEACEKGSHSQDALVFRRATGDDPNTNTKIDRLPESNETYIGDPTQIAASRWQLLMDMWPPELDGSKIWTVSLNEPSKEPANFRYLAQYALEEARLAIEQNKKVLSFGFSGGTPSREFWESPYMLEYLRLAAQYPNNIGVSLHEYSFDGNSLKTGYPYLLGRFQELHDVCDQHGINRPTIIVGEFGAGENEWLGDVNHKMSDIQWAQNLYEPYDNILGACCWTLGSWGGSIVNDVLSLVEPITNVAKDYPYSPPDDIEPPPPIDPPTSTQLFKVDFTGWGERDNQEPVGWHDSTTCVNVQVPYAIFPDGRYPMGFENFEGANPYGDGEPWNDFTCPEAVVKWGDLLPPNEHCYLNDQGRTQHWFCPAKAGRSRFKRVVSLETGTYRLILDAYGDFAQFENGQKIEQNDPEHGQVELFVGTNGIDEMININLIGDNHITKEFTVDAGEYEVGYGLLSRWAGGGGTAGFFMKGFEIELVSEPVDPPIEPPPINAPKIVIVKKPQLADMTFAENQEVSQWCFTNYGRTSTHSTDDMLRMLEGGNEESYGVIWWSNRQQSVIDTLIENGFNYILMPDEPEPEPTPDIPITISPQLSQRDPQWSNDSMGVCRNIPRTIGSWGCMATTYTMLHSRYYDTLTPPEMIKLMQESGGMNSACLNGGALTTTFPDEWVYEGYKYRTSGETGLRNRVRDYVDVGIPVICQVDFNPSTGQLDDHWVLVVNYDDSNFWAIDPWTGNKIRVNDVYGVAGSDLLQAVYYYPSNMEKPVVVDREEVPLPPVGQSVQTAPYFEPVGDIGVYAVFHFDAGNTQPQQLRRIGDRTIMFKGEGQWFDDRLMQDYEEWSTDIDGVHKYVDTSDAGNGGRDGYNLHGEVWLPATVHVGQTYISTPLVTRFNRVDCVVHSNEQTTDYLYIKEVVPHWVSPKNSNISFDEVLVVEWRKTSNLTTPPIETYKFAKGVGYVEWNGAAIGELPQGRNPLGGELTNC